ncbi:hypothetical protein [Arthrobacter woluwensis]|uniref:hypothetical protein n=1 Tax=Arthrobacter woluwensis TaxID=156980 RepID=UPI001AAEAD45|nr:hypothetical protein [Arthrobacter woluwensis]QTF71442.1 hypothetical protein G8758_05060 [Arthrobacter woluwensis]
MVHRRGGFQHIMFCLHHLGRGEVEVEDPRRAFGDGHSQEMSAISLGRGEVEVEDPRRAFGDGHSQEMSAISPHQRSDFAVVACPGKSAVSMRRWKFLAEVWVDMARAASVGSSTDA